MCTLTQGVDKSEACKFFDPGYEACVVRPPNHLATVYLEDRSCPESVLIAMSDAVMVTPIGPMLDCCTEPLMRTLLGVPGKL